LWRESHLVAREDADAAVGACRAPPAQYAPPSPPRMTKAISADPSSKLMPVQSQPRASLPRYSLDHS
jgi:hypothetical protein